MIEESETGRNEPFLTLLTGEGMTLDEFVAKIEKCQYPGNYLVDINGMQTPVSKPDEVLVNNLGE